jgi:hypothetical protein
LDIVLLSAEDTAEESQLLGLRVIPLTHYSVPVGILIALGFYPFNAGELGLYDLAECLAGVPRP